MPWDVNPYVPGQPASPELFAGRSELIQKAEDAMEEATKIRRSSAILLHGYRGSGKTSAIRKIQSLARMRSERCLISELQLRAHSSEDQLLASIVADLKRQVESRGGVAGRLKSWLERVNSVSLGGIGIGLAPKGAANSGHGLMLWRSLVDALEEVAFLVVCIDDAELLDSTGIGALKTIAESHSPTPIILVVAGGVELSDRLAQKDASPIARIFSGSRYDIGEFSESETRTALEAPVVKMGGTARWTSDGVREVQSLSHGYPYLVQCVASASYTEGRPLDANRVRQSVEGALKVASSWLEKECADASDEDIRAFAKIAGTHRTELRSSEIISLGIQSPYIGRLVRQKILKKISRGHYELRKAPVIAYYHALQRKLVVS